jgi:hypothetical protein
MKKSIHGRVELSIHDYENRITSNIGSENNNDAKFALHWTDKPDEEKGCETKKELIRNLREEFEKIIDRIESCL